MVDTLDYSQPSLRYKNFITECLALYSVSDNVRSIPSVVDGLKPTQRKVLYTCLNHKGEHKVSSLAGLVSSFTNYHHGDMSLSTTIVSMAQSFTGSNNLNLLLPLG
jgi:DNA topoisomerase-2